MSGRRVLRTSMALLWCVAALAGEAQPGTESRSAPLMQSASGRYRVSVALQPGDDLAAVSAQLAGTYRGRLEPYAEAGFRGFVIVTTEGSARLLGADPRVLSIEPVGAAAAVTERPALPASEQEPGFPAPAAESTVSWSTGTYAYDRSGNIKSIGTVEKYVYDAFGRLTSGTVASGKVQASTYDDFGNLLTITIDGDSANRTLMGVNRNTNRASEAFDPQTGAARNAFGAYDGEGNMVSNVVGDTFVYDGLGMVKESTVAGQRRLHLYAPNEERIASVAIRSNAVAETVWTIRNPGGAVLSRFTRSAAGAWSWDEDYIYRDGKLLAAEVSGPEKVRHFHLDHLGTPRLITGNGGAELSRHIYYPFGREVDPPASGERLKFTGHERDHSTLDYMHARYYANMWGRFLSVDPVNSATPSAPQSWNRYVYARNNPLALVDRNGKWPSMVVHTHQNAIDFTLRTLPARDRQILKQAQVTADFDQQNQYKHAMRNPGQSPRDAAILANTFIDTAMNRAVALEKAGNHAGALLNVGLAMHTLQDNTSPMHMGIQQFDPNAGNLSGATLGHVRGELFDPSGTPQQSGLGENLDRATYDSYAHFARAAGLPVPPVPQCDGKPCFEPSGSIHIEVPPK